MIYYRICIETLLPTSQRPAAAPDGYSHAVAQQFPVSEWIEISEWPVITEDVRRKCQVHKMGLMLGYQSKDDGKPYEIEKSLAEFKGWKTSDDIDAWVTRRNAERKRVFDDAVGRIDAFIATFDFDAYGLSEVLGIPGS